MKSHPEWYSDFDSLESALSNAKINNRLIYAWVNGKAYKIYPGGRNERRPTDDKVTLPLGTCAKVSRPHLDIGECDGSWKPLPAECVVDRKFAEDFVEVFGGFPKDQAIAMLIRRQAEIRNKAPQTRPSIGAREGCWVRGIFFEPYEQTARVWLQSGGVRDLQMVQVPLEDCIPVQGTFECPTCGKEGPHQHVIDRKGNVIDEICPRCHLPYSEHRGDKQAQGYICPRSKQ